MHTPVVTCVVVFSTVSKNLLTRWRFPPEYSRLVETDKRTVTVCTHVYILKAKVRQKFCEAPTDTIHVVLHSKFCLQAFFLEKLQRSQRCCKSLFVRQFVEVKVHTCKFDTAFFYSLLQTFDLLGRLVLQVFAYRPRDFASPLELSKLRIRIGSIAIIQCIVDVALVFSQDFHLRTGVTDISVGMLNHVHCPLTNRRNSNLTSFLFASGQDFIGKL